METETENGPAWSLDTQLVHGGLSHHAHRDSRAGAGVPTAPPICASTTFLHAEVAALDRAFEGKQADGSPAFVYARQGNPGAQALEETMARIEGGVGAVAFGSGMAAIHTALLAAGLAPGVKILAAQDLFGVTLGLIRKVFVPLGVELVLRDLCGPDAAEIIRAEQPDIVFVETLSNPLVKVTDLRAIGAAARAVGAVSIVDATFTTPYLLRPLAHGCDLAVHSATKYLGGHGDSTGGIVVSARNALLEALRTYAAMVGAMLSPFDAYLILRGMRTLALRMERHSRNALQLARYLQGHPAVAAVHYPGLPTHSGHEVAAALLPDGHYGGVLSFELQAQTRAAAFALLDRLRLCLPATTLGDVYSEVSYPPISSHRNLSEAERRQIGITEGCIRVSAGIEDSADILADFEQALAGVEA